MPINLKLKLKQRYFIMILINGCSFTSGDAITEPGTNRYSKILESLLDEQIINLAQSSKNNFYAAFELTAFLTHRMHNKEEMPTTIIWQHTDVYRNHLSDWAYSGSWKPNNLQSIVGQQPSFHDRFVKIISWERLSSIWSDRSSFKNESDFKRYTRLYGMGAELNNNNRSRRAYKIGDETFMLHQLQHFANLFNIQTLCESLDIRLVHYNYYPPIKGSEADPMYKLINDNDFVISNHSVGGIYNHLLWRGFDRPDNFHFNEAAHLYQAHVLYDFIVNNKQLEVEEDGHGDYNYYPMFDYVSEPSEQKKKPTFIAGRRGRELLLNLANPKSRK